MMQQRNNPWLVCLLPFAVFMLVGTLEPSPPKADDAAASKPFLDLGIEYRHYSVVYAAKILATVAAIGFVWPGYRSFPWRVSALGVGVGVVGAVVWIALSHLQHAAIPKLVEQTGFEWLNSLGARSAFNPLEELKSNLPWAYAFLAIRFVGLVLVVPVIEEFFLRGFVMRYVQDERWWEVPFGNVNRTAIIAGTLVPVLMHPQEALAALVWFSMITWLMIRTRSIGDCILAHAITNLSLGVYVVATGNWWLM